MTIKTLGVIDRYECGIMDRIEAWGRAGTQMRGRT